MLKPVLAILAAMALAAMPAFADEQWIEPFDNGQIAFLTPSGNIGCLYTPEGGTDVYEPVDSGPELICERLEPSYVTIILGPNEEALRVDDPGEQSCCGDDERLAYGNELVLDGFYCLPEKTGLTCSREDGEHGFFVSRAKIETW